MSVIHNVFVLVINMTSILMLWILPSLTRKSHEILYGLNKLVAIIWYPVDTFGPTTFSSSKDEVNHGT